MKKGTLPHPFSLKFPVTGSPAFISAVESSDHLIIRGSPSFTSTVRSSGGVKKFFDNSDTCDFQIYWRVSGAFFSIWKHWSELKYNFLDQPELAFWLSSWSLGFRWTGSIAARHGSRPSWLWTCLSSCSLNLATISTQGCLQLTSIALSKLLPSFTATV